MLLATFIIRKRQGLNSAAICGLMTFECHLHYIVWTCGAMVSASSMLMLCQLVPPLLRALVCTCWTADITSGPPAPAVNTSPLHLTRTTSHTFFLPPTLPYTHLALLKDDWVPGFLVSNQETAENYFQANCDFDNKHCHSCSSFLCYELGWSL